MNNCSVVVMSTELLFTLQQRWNELERLQQRSEGKIPPDLARYYSCEKVRAARKLAKAGIIMVGYTDPEAPYEMQWAFDPERAERLLAQADALTA